MPFRALALLLGVALGCWWTASFLRSRALRGEPWERWSDAEGAGYSAEGLGEVLSYTRGLGTTGLMVVVGGKVLVEHGDTEAIGYMAGGRYTVAAMVFGSYVADGTLDLGSTLGELGIDDREGLLPAEQRATIDDILTQRSGVYHPSNFGANPPDTPPRGSVEPGTSFHYHPWGPLALKTIFELLTGRDLFQAIGEELADPLGLQDFKWWRQNPGHDRYRSDFTVWNLYVSTRDVARFGQLMLQKGTWKGEVLIPPEWVERMTTLVTPPEGVSPEGYGELGLGFGRQWWVWDDSDPRSPFQGAYTYWGASGQYLTVIPKLDMVVAHQVFSGWFGPPERTVSWREYSGILDRLVAARTARPPSGPSRPPEPQPPARTSGTAGRSPASPGARPGSTTTHGNPDGSRPGA